MEKSITIIYDIVNPGKSGTAVEKSIIDELKRINGAVETPINGVVINCRQSGKKPVAMPTFDRVLKLQNDLQIGEISINKSYSNEEFRTPREILEELRRLHDELGALIDDNEEASEDDGSALQNIYAEMEEQLDALEDAIDFNENGLH